MTNIEYRIMNVEVLIRADLYHSEHDSRTEPSEGFFSQRKRMNPRRFWQTLEDFCLTIQTSYESYISEPGSMVFFSTFDGRHADKRLSPPLKPVSNYQYPGRDGSVVNISFF